MHWYFSILAAPAEPPHLPKEKTFEKSDAMTQHFWKVIPSSLVFALPAAEQNRIQCNKGKEYW